MEHGRLVAAVLDHRLTFGGQRPRLACGRLGVHQVRVVRLNALQCADDLLVVVAEQRHQVERVDGSVLGDVQQDLLGEFGLHDGLKFRLATQWRAGLDPAIAMMMGQIGLMQSQ